MKKATYVKEKRAAYKDSRHIMKKATFVKEKGLHTRIVGI